jgi:signal transduction histidine kinase
MYDIQTKEVPLYLAFTLLAVIFIFFLLASVIKMKNRQVKREEDSFRAVIAERERTMYTISVELHNNMNQMLSLAKMTIQLIEKSALPQQKKYIEESIKMLDNVIIDISNMSHSLNSDYLKHHGLYDFVNEEIQWINISKKFKCTFDVEGEYKSFDEDTELILIRIIQEVIQNTIKHANAQNLSINMRYNEDDFLLSIKDDGKGFDPSHNPARMGMGLQSIYNRCGIINCDVEIDSNDNFGTEIRLRIRRPRYKNASATESDNRMMSLL